jgi:hypothetical protein
VIRAQYLHSKRESVCKGQDVFPDLASLGKLLTESAKKLDMNDNGSLLDC